MTTSPAQLTKAFAYLRVSGLSQVEGDGFDRQLAACHKYALAHNLAIVETFREEGVSGATDLDSRKALPALMVALESNGVRTVVIEKMDRLARDLMIQETIIADMQRRGFTLISAMEPDLCSTDPSRVLMRQIFGAIAQYDKAMIVLKLKAGLERKRALTGRAQGRLPYGARLGEAETLERMREMRETGFTQKAIAEALNSVGLVARYGLPWKTSTVGKILTRSRGIVS
jgi:DNA invertase Pin-like site-specific DNA recombinase